MEALFKQREVTCPIGEPVWGIKIICGCSFGTWFLFMMKDWAGLRLIYNTNTKWYKLNSQPKFLDFLAITRVSTSSALSFPFLLNLGPTSFDCTCTEWFCLWLKTGEFCPFKKKQQKKENCFNSSAKHCKWELNKESYKSYLIWLYEWLASWFKLRLVWSVAISHMAIEQWACTMTTHGGGVVVLNHSWTSSNANPCSKTDIQFCRLIF